MPISVITGGPISEDAPEIDTSEPTFSTMMGAIADDIDDTVDEYTSQIRDAISASIRYCERDIFYFNETRDVTFPTVDGQEWYDDADNSNIPTLKRIVAVYSEDTSGQRTMLRRMTPEEIETLADNTAASGEPYGFTYFGQRLRLYPIPSATVYTIRLQLGPYKLALLTNINETNAWFTEAYDLIKARAKYILAKDTLKDAPLAVEALNDFNDQYDALKAETSRRNGRGVIQVTCF